jgi:hypothetical protein
MTVATAKPPAAAVPAVRPFEGKVFTGQTVTFDMLGKSR